MSEILDIVNGISQALASKQDGGDKFGLEREKETSMYDKRIMDGFGVSFSGNHIIVKYHSEVPLTRVHGKDFKGEVEQMMADITKHLKEKYRAVKKSTLELKKVGDCNILVQTPNRRTAFINASQTYKLGIDEKKDEAVKHFEERADRYAKQWLNIMRTK